MANVIIRSYNTFFDHQTNVQFDPILDKTTGHYIGLAQIGDDLVPYFRKNPAYDVITDAELSEITTGSAPVPGVNQTKVKADLTLLTEDVFGTAPTLPRSA